MAVLRAQYAIPWGRLVLQPGLLGIIHLAEDVEVLSTEPLVRGPSRVPRAPP